MTEVFLRPAEGADLLDIVAARLRSAGHDVEEIGGGLMVSPPPAEIPPWWVAHPPRRYPRMHP